MSLIPAFEIGVWNVWIFMVAWVFFHMVPLDWPIFRYDLKGTFRKGSASPPYNKTEKKILYFSKVTMLSLVIYSIFLPLQLGTTWFYIGITLCILGLVIYTIVWVNIITTPLGEPITKGLYRYSRHPMYLTNPLIFIGVSIACASWIFLLLSTVFTILHFINAIPEERLCLEAYGAAYRGYMNRTPRWIGIPKSGGK